MKYNLPALMPAIIDKLLGKVANWWWRLRTPALCWLWGVKIGRGTCFLGKSYLRSHGQGITIGENVVFNSCQRNNLVGLTGATIIDNRLGGKIAIGNACGFSSVVISSKSTISIGGNVMVGGNVRIFDHDFHSMNSLIRGTYEDSASARTKPVVIEDDCFIGTNAIILKGTHLGARTIVSAGSVVFGLATPPDSLVKGNPAKVVQTKSIFSLH